ncbi:hypothetical protein [Zestomonas carbonaria]|uniref:Uncharacterized protein n=1 Tax=Zestomonas carbonaria TaxID=2762745 RepID=A0A7U7ELT3_9GAMM|nr:hypothetical protein [Pseudomonas carbonaria]CAD5107206.1 hypothetical protein PSEWESI4_01477 [Pseudomonas carbonaria]
MQKAILTFKDKAGGNVDVNLSFDPPVKGSSTMTPAISLGFQALDVLKKAEHQRSVDLDQLQELIRPVAHLANRYVANLHKGDREYTDAIADLSALNDALTKLPKPASDEEE